MIVFGMFMTSIAYEYWQIILAQGLFMGIGLGCVFMPSVGMIASYFVKRRGMAMGIASTGSTLGERSILHRQSVVRLFRTLRWHRVPLGLF